MFDTRWGECVSRHKKKGMRKVFDALFSGTSVLRDIMEAVYTAVTCTTTESFDVNNVIHNIGVDVCIARSV